MERERERERIIDLFSSLESFFLLSLLQNLNCQMGQTICAEYTWTSVERYSAFSLKSLISRSLRLPAP